MGMFDTFMIPDPKNEGQFLQIQTKQFDNFLRIFYLGDTLIDNQYDNPNQYVVQEIYGVPGFENKWITFIIVDGIFVDYTIQHTQYQATVQGLKMLTQCLNEQGYYSSLLSDLIKVKNVELSQQQNKIDNALTKVLSVYKFLKEDKDIFKTDESVFAKWHDPFINSVNKPAENAPKEEKLEFLLNVLIDDITYQFPSYTGKDDPDQKKRSDFL